MAESSLLKIISETLVKPSSPTPPSSKYYKFSLFDVYVGDSMTPVAFFYPKGTFPGGNSSRREIFELLETSLSKTLTYYYPFAGRFMDDNITVDCNDAGVKVWEVEIRSSLSEILNNRKGYHTWNAVFLPEMYLHVISHVMIQLTYFECGGICLVISLAHKLGDAISLANFINDWAAIALGSQAISPVLSGASIFPPPTCQVNNTSVHERKSDYVTQRFVFSASNISKLKQELIKQTEIKNPTQTEVVTALIFKSAMSAASKINSSGTFKPSSLMQIANFRPLIIPPLPEQLVGNFVNRFFIFVTEEKERDLSRILTEMRKSKIAYLDAHRARIEGDEFHNRFLRFFTEDQEKLNGKDFDTYIFTSCFRFPFYEVDFGFGKPIFVCQPGGLVEQTTVMLGTPRGNEIDAFVTLKKDQMSIFEHDEELLAFSTVNPIICVEN